MTCLRKSGSKSLVVRVVESKLMVMNRRKKLVGQGERGEDVESGTEF